MWSRGQQPNNLRLNHQMPLGRRFHPVAQADRNQAMHVPLGMAFHNIDKIQLGWAGDPARENASGANSHPAVFTTRIYKFDFPRNINQHQFFGGNDLDQCATEKVLRL
jgi:hypothetical protein